MSGTIQERISVVIPALDAAETLPAALAPLRTPMVGEVIVVDGGSRDATLDIAREMGARVVTAPRGRGSQLAAGAAAAAGDWLLFLHADCRLVQSSTECEQSFSLSPGLTRRSPAARQMAGSSPAMTAYEGNVAVSTSIAPGRGWRGAVTAFISEPHAAECAAYFRLVLDDERPAARRLERIVAWRCRALGLPYGDQGLLISRKLYERVGGFAPIPLMEDVDLARRLGRRRLVTLDASCIASARRYRHGGYWRRPLRNLLCLSLYFAGVPPRRVARLYG